MHSAVVVHGLQFVAVLHRFRWIQLVAVVKEWIQAEIDDFQSKFWPNDELYLDEEKVRFRGVCMHD